MASITHVINNIFPNIGTSYLIQNDIPGKSNDNYNCIAFTVDDFDNKIFPISNMDFKWPLQSRINSIDNFVEFYKLFGYIPCGKNFSYDNKFNKIALYVDKNNFPTHAAKQYDEKYWESKIGNYERILHTLEGLEGSHHKYSYGCVHMVFRKIRLY